MNRRSLFRALSSAALAPLVKWLPVPYGARLLRFFRRDEVFYAVAVAILLSAYLAVVYGLAMRAMDRIDQSWPAPQEEA